MNIINRPQRFYIGFVIKNSLLSNKSMELWTEWSNIVRDGFETIIHKKNNEMNDSRKDKLFSLYILISKSHVAVMLNHRWTQNRQCTSFLPFKRYMLELPPVIKDALLVFLSIISCVVYFVCLLLNKTNTDTDCDACLVFAYTDDK